MKLLLIIVVFLLKALIKIGDFVLFIFNFIWTAFWEIIKNIFSLSRFFQEITTKAIKVLCDFLEIKIRATKYSFALLKNKSSNFFSFYFRKRQPLPKAPRVKEIKKPQKRKMVVIFPLSFSIKLRYFLMGFFFSLSFIFLPLLIFIFLQELPSPRLMSYSQIPQTTKIYDRNGTLLYQIYASQNRTLISLNEVPKSLQQATIAIEDKDFYKHPGFDVAAILRSLIKNISGNQLQGGSTITQQLVKSALLTPETKIERKIKEIILAFWAERIYSKNQILELYFNYVPYGGTAWGVEAAAEVYFGKKAKELTLAQSAFLAGIPKAPTLYSPFGENPNLWQERQREVLKKMVDQGFISKEEAKKASEEELVFKAQQTPIYAPHFVMFVKDFLVRKYGLSAVEKGGLNVTTSLDLKLQEMAEKIVADEVNNDFYLNLTNGAALVTNPGNGDILAMVGSKDYQEAGSGNVNVTTSLRQPGSAIKVVTYSKALSSGLTAATILDDSPISFTSAGSPPYSPVNYDGKFHGRVSLRIAFANSFNVPAVKVLNQIGVENMMALGKKMGIRSWTDPKNYGLSLTLGGGDLTMVELATVYGTAANKGERVDLNPILKITDYQSNVLEEKSNPQPFRVLDEGVTFIISNILSDNAARSMEFGSVSPLTIPNRTVSVKTGTSDNKRDNWTIGYTPSYVVAVWVGNNDNSPMSQSLASGITGAAPIWNKIMTNLLMNKPDEKYEIPPNVIQKPCIGRLEYFIKGTENSINCTYTPSPSPSPGP